MIWLPTLWQNFISLNLFKKNINQQLPRIGRRCKKCHPNSKRCQIRLAVLDFENQRENTMELALECRWNAASKTSAQVCSKPVTFEGNLRIPDFPTKLNWRKCPTGCHHPNPGWTHSDRLGWKNTLPPPRNDPNILRWTKMRQKINVTSTVSACGRQ